MVIAALAMWVCLSIPAGLYLARCFSDAPCEPAELTPVSGSNVFDNI